MCRAGLVAVLAFAGCRCDRGSSLQDKYGELVIVTHTVDGDELLSRDATFALDPVPMGTVGTGAVTLRNIGSAPLTLAQVSQASGDEGFAAEAPLQALKPGEELPLIITFAASQTTDPSIDAVASAARFQLTVGDARPGEDSAFLTVSASAVAKDCYVPALVDFGLAPIGARVGVARDLSNASPLDVTASVGTLTGDEAASFDAAPVGEIAVSANGTQALTLGFTPTEARDYAATLMVRRAGTCPWGTVRLQGRGSPDAVSWAPSSLDFGRLPLGDRAIRHVRITNRSGATLAVRAAATTGAGFQAGPRLPAEVPAFGTADVEVTCAPSVLGRFAGELDFELGTTPPMPARIPLSCGGGGPRISVKPSALAFGVVPFTAGGSPTTTLVLHVQNVGTPPIAGEVEANLHLGHGGRPPFAQVFPLGTGTSASDFFVTLPQGYDPVRGIEAVAGRNDLPLEVRFTPSSPGRKSADLIIASDDVNAPEVHVTLTADAETAGPCLLASAPSQLAFGDLPPGVTIESKVQLANLAATGACLVAGLGLTAGSDPAFTLVSPGRSWLSINAGMTAEVTVRLTMPPGLPEGSAVSGFLRFTTSSPAAPEVVVPLIARSVGCVAVTPSVLAFGMQRPGCRTASRTVNVYNRCTTPVAVTGTSLSGPEFVVTKAPALGAGGVLTLGAGAHASADLAFAPTVLGQAQGSYRLEFTQADAGLFSTVALSGTGDDGGVRLDVFDIPPQPRADILFVVDDSCSMANKQTSLATNFSSFMQEAMTLNVDYHLAVTTTDNSPSGERGRFLGTPTNPPVLTPQFANVATLFAQKAMVGTNGSGTEEPIACAIAALTPPLIGGANAGFVRSDASLAVVVVSDASDQSEIPIAYALSRLFDVKGSDQAWLFSFNVVGPFTPPPRPQGCTIDTLPDDGTYRALVDATHGVVVDVCTTDWAGELGRVGKSVFGLKSAFPLSAPPQNGTLPQVLVNGVPATGWSWDAVTNTVVFSPAAVPPAGATVTARYAPACY